MTGLHVTVPIACWRKGLAREYLETEDVPPPSTCYGFLLSLVGEVDRRRHIGSRVTGGTFGAPSRSVVLRTVWRVKSRPLGSPGNTRPDYQQLVTGDSPEAPFVEVAIWVDSSEEKNSAGHLEERVAAALDPSSRRSVDRFGGLSLGESTHLVDSVWRLDDDRRMRLSSREFHAFFLTPDRGRLTLPVWVDHVGSAGTRFVVGDLEPWSIRADPPADRLPLIVPPEV